MKPSELLARHGSDKHLGHHQHGHSYGPLYDTLLTPIRDSVRVVFEAGVLGGASLRAWRDFFPNAVVIGLDLNVEPYTEDRIEVYRGDATDPAAVEAALKGRKVGFFCEDASHLEQDQFATADLMVAHMAPDGVMAIEDLQHPSADAGLRARGFEVYDFRQQRLRHDDAVAVKVVS